MVILIPKKMKVKFLGGTKEVGRSAIAVKSTNSQILLDYGVLMDRTPGFPMHIPPNDVDAIVLTHAHLDHSGAIPIFHVNAHKPVYGTSLSFELSRLLITDFIYLSGYYLPYEYIDLQNMLNCAIFVDYHTPLDIGDLKIQLIESGHIPGGAQVIVESEGKRLLYTSDFNTIDSQLLKGASQADGVIDILIMESTYANAEHENRRETEKRFIEKLYEVVENGGTVLVPAFSVGRSQEILCVLAAYDFKYSITVDGMAKNANKILAAHPTFLRDYQLFMNAINSAKWIKGWRDRRLAAKKPGVIVSPAGMLKGGNAIFYMNSIAKKKENAIFLVSYQVPDSPGAKLLERKQFVLGGKMKKVKAAVDHFNFTSHSGKTQLLDTAKKTNGNAKVFIIHGAEENCQTLAQIIEDEIGLETHAPKSGEVYTI